MEKRRKEKKNTQKESFFCDLAPEIDIFGSQKAFPEWIYAYREEQLRSMSPFLRRFCRKLKEAGAAFKIKYPMEEGGKWRFADVYVPGKQAVVIQASSFTNRRPIGLLSDRSEFFKGRCKVYEIESCDSSDSIDRLVDSLAAL